jgi:hypothetical protein
MKVDKKAIGGVQQTLDEALEKASEVKMFTCDGTTHAVAQFVACNDQVSVMPVVVQCTNTDIVEPGSCSY